MALQTAKSLRQEDTVDWLLGLEHETSALLGTALLPSFPLIPRLHGRRHHRRASRAEDMSCANHKAVRIFALQQQRRRSTL